jgi:hypothetical protein
VKTANAVADGLKLTFADGREQTVSISKRTTGGGAMLRWTNAAGQTLNARFGGISGRNVILILEDGRRTPYPLASLSAESRALATKLSGASRFPTR